MYPFTGIEIHSLLYAFCCDKKCLGYFDHNQEYILKYFKDTIRKRQS